MEEADRLSQEVISRDSLLPVEENILRQVEKPKRRYTNNRGDDPMCGIKPDDESGSAR